MACWRKLVANPCPLTLFFYPPRACAHWSETLTYSSGGSSREGLDLGGSFGRFGMARRFGRKLQTPFIGFGKGQSQLLSSRLRVKFKKPSLIQAAGIAGGLDFYLQQARTG
jgi:hypothetical protein